MIINEPGNYILKYTATDECGNSSVVERELEVKQPPFYGAVWDGSESSKWTRTGLSADFADPQPAVANGTGSSPFDNIMPWSGMEVVEDAEAGTLVSIPKFYYKWVRDELNEGSMELRISNEPISGFLTSPAHADRGDGVGERDVVYVGRYHCGNSYKSISNITPTTGVTERTFRTNIHALGSDIWQYDFAMYWTIAMLYLVEFADWNSQASIGYGCSSDGSVELTGLTDAMQYHTGTNASSRDAYGQVQYRHIEGLWSNCYDYCDGVLTRSNSVYCRNNPSDYTDSIGVFSGNCSRTSGVPIKFSEPSITDYEYALFPYVTDGNDYTKHICDNYVYASSGSTQINCVSIGGRATQFQGSGLFCIGNNIKVGTFSTDVGSRLQKLPSA